MEKQSEKTGETLAISPEGLVANTIVCTIKENNENSEAIDIDAINDFFLWQFNKIVELQKRVTDLEKYILELNTVSA